MTATPSTHGLVTGASSGIGRAVALALAARGTALLLSGRDRGQLNETAAAVARHRAPVAVHAGDLDRDDGIRDLVAEVGRRLGRLDVVVHAAGRIVLGEVAGAGWGDLDDLYRTNVRAPLLLTKALLPLLLASRGQVLFLNSTAGLAAGADNVLYASTKAALHVLADGLRRELQGRGVRVITVFPGRTATPMQDAVLRHEGRAARDVDLLTPDEVAEVVVSALSTARTVSVTDLVVRSMPGPGGQGGLR